MRATVLVASLAAASSVSALSFPLSRRQYEGCETPCDPMRDWAYGCRTDTVGCQQQCTAELLEATDNCYTCIKEKNPGEAGKIGGYVTMAYQMCGTEAPSGLVQSGGASADADKTSTGAAESGSQTAVASPTASNATASATGSAAANATASAPSGSASAPVSTPTSGASKFGISLGAIALAASAFLL